MPVEAISTSSGSILSASAVQAQTCRAASTPASPVQALAKPLFATIARMLSDAARCSLLTCMGAANTLLVVNFATACAGSSE